MRPISYRYCHVPPVIIQHAVWLYARFALSFRDVEHLLAERGIEVSYETIRRWVARFGPEIRRRLRSHRSRPHSLWHLDELRSYAAAFRDLGLTARHHQARWKNNRIEGSDVYVRRRERTMQGFRSPRAAQRFLSLHAATYNVFNTRRHLSPAAHHRECRRQAFAAWREAADVAA